MTFDAATKDAPHRQEARVEGGHRFAKPCRQHFVIHDSSDAGRFCGSTWGGSRALKSGKSDS